MTLRPEPKYQRQHDESEGEHTTRLWAIWPFCSSTYTVLESTIVLLRRTHRSSVDSEDEIFDLANSIVGSIPGGIDDARDRKRAAALIVARLLNDEGAMSW